MKLLCLNKYIALFLLISLTPFLMITSALAKQQFTLLSVDAQRYPLIKTTIRHNFDSLATDDISISVQGRHIAAFMFKPDDDEPMTGTIKWLASGKNQEKEHFTITIFHISEEGFYNNTGKTSHGDDLPEVNDPSVKIYTTGPEGIHIPCRIVAVHENGRIFEDITTKGGYGKMGTGLAIPPGNITVELRLTCPDVSLCNFQAMIDTSKPTVIQKTFGYLALPLLKHRYTKPSEIHMEIENVVGRYPSIRSNLSILNNKMNKHYKAHYLPLPEGEYMVTIMPGTSDSLVERQKQKIKVISGKICELDLRDL